MKRLVVVERPEHWPLRAPDVELVAAGEYLMDPAFSRMKGAKVYNCCRRYRYQSSGYYVSLLAEARGHRPLPSVATLQDLRLQPLLRIVGDDLENLIQRSLAPLKSDAFELSIYFGRNVARTYDRLARALFNQYPSPFLRASFQRTETWQLTGIRAIATSEIPETHRPFVLETMREHFRSPERGRRRHKPARYDLAILRNEEEVDAPTNPAGIRKFIRAADALGVRAQVISKEDLGSLAEYDALFIRETTSVNHHTFRFARKAAAEGMVVVDDPQSILRCTNKVYQAELFMRNGISIPRTIVANAEASRSVLERIGLPCVVKSPDSSFSRGVTKANTEEELRAMLGAFLESSDLAVVQEFLPSSFDWRVGVLDGRALYACRYHMAANDWKIIATGPLGGRRYGAVETLPIEEAPGEVVDLAVRCAKLVGSGLYGVDIKESGGRFHVIEINDNPSVDAGYEDAVLGDELYRIIMAWFVDRLDGIREGRGGRP